MDIQEQLKRDEGLRLKPYRDTVGKLTIGYGRNLDDKGITAEEAGALLWNDIQAAQGELFGALPWAEKLDEPRQMALLNMSFNMGIHGLLTFKNTLNLAENGHYAAAAAAMLDSKWAEQVGARAQRIAKQMESGVWV